MKREGALLGDPPAREVSRVVDLVGPRGGIIYVLMLGCGHWRTARKLPAKMIVPCVGCLVSAALHARRTTWEDITDAQLVELGRSARGTSNEQCLIRQLVPVALGLHKESVAEVQHARRRCARFWNARFARHA
jgi:hypothetical protein